MLKEIYQKEIVPKLKDEIGKGSPYGVPTLVKIVLNCGVGREKDQRESLDKAKEELSRIAGQTPSFRFSRFVNNHPSIVIKTDVGPISPTYFFCHSHNDRYLLGMIGNYAVWICAVDSDGNDVANGSKTRLTFFGNPNYTQKLCS